MFKLDGGWVGQDQFERCSNLEIRTEKWTLPNLICIHLNPSFRQKLPKMQNFSTFCTLAFDLELYTISNCTSSPITLQEIKVLVPTVAPGEAVIHKTIKQKPR